MSQIMSGEEEKLQEIPDMDTLVRELRRIYQGQEVNVEEVKDVLSRYKSSPADWRKYAKFDPLRYTRNLVDDFEGKFNLIALCWGEGHASSIHDHSSADCFVKMLDGELEETMYHWPTEEELQEGGEGKSDEIKIKMFDVNSMGLHRMANPSHSNKTVSLHLYSPPFKSCRVFDQRTGKTSVVKVTFNSKYGELLHNETLFAGSSTAWNPTKNKAQ
ncbi:hypothetical protein HELRODRAFT_187713 [Helobdella robusta]|uniref:Cysteine dioxygenase n=1 Tax=Helobdella robusta TaxID=6412 RepID=T1FPC2_HELRO|nr:hypothetical protein HELRODRAFT_187713 [Helobdella robusta]ESO10350.1 hypothetical protein HELRODRAFT_187713 [Helobdella robusta]